MWGDEHWFFFSFKAYSFFEIHSSFESYACFLNGFSELLPENSEPLQGGVLNMRTLGVGHVSPGKALYLSGSVVHIAKGLCSANLPN